MAQLGMKDVYLLVGVPGSGKSWIGGQLEEKFDYLPHDDFIGPDHNKAYVSAVKRLSTFASKPILIETPFSMSQLIQPLVAFGFNVIPVFIFEDEHVLSDRYEKREGRPYNKGNISRQNTYKSRVTSEFSGTSEEVLNHLRGI